MRMKTIVISALAIVVFMSLTASVLHNGVAHSKNPQSAYQLGFKWGVRDARVTCKPDCRDVYIFQPGNTCNMIILPN